MDCQLRSANILQTVITYWIVKLSPDSDALVMRSRSDESAFVAHSDSPHFAMVSFELLNTFKLDRTQALVSLIS